MRLPADRREWLEAVCRAGALAILAFLIFRALFPVTVSREDRVVTARISDLALLSRGESPKAIHFTLDSTPGHVERAWQKSLRSAGSVISWEGKLSSVALSARANLTPAGGQTLLVAAPPGSTVKLRDDISAIDSATVKVGAHAVQIPIVSGSVRAVTERGSASVLPSDSVVLRRILVLGKAGWETKFALAALEEAGWATDAITTVAPGITVTQGSVPSIDTARYGAVVALDESAASRARDISAFVRSGGGLVLADGAAKAPAFAAMRLASSLPRAVSSADSDAVSRLSSAFSSLQLVPDAVAIEQRGSSVVVAARRIDFGRVIQTGYDETWRWRLQGGESSVAEHRDWWSSVVGRVTFAQRIARQRGADTVSDDPAPYADLVAIAGKPFATEVHTSITERSFHLIWVLILFALLTTEWTSRRLRGAR